MTHKKVVGVSYDLEDSAPAVIVKGVGAEAEAAVERARDADIPIVKDPQLVRELYKVPLDAPIGKDLFQVMAALLAHVIYIDRKSVDTGSRGGVR